jgi:pimeloyl-ACP methyl ester carboxylesterase
MTLETTTPAVTQRSLQVWNGRLTIRVHVSGTGDPLLYLHPLTGLRWDPVLTRLSEQYTVYAPEFPGTTPGDPYAIHVIDELPDLVLAYEEVIRELGLDDPVILGQSFGGMLAAELAATFPDLPAKLVLIDALGLWSGDEPVASWLTTPADRMPGLLFHDPAGPAARSMLQPPADPDQMRAAIAARIWALGCTGKFTWPIPDRGLDDRLHRVRARTLILWGEQDRLVPASYARRFADLIPGSTVTMIGDSGHLPQVEQPERTAAALVDFLGSDGDAGGAVGR